MLLPCHCYRVDMQCSSHVDVQLCAMLQSPPPITTSPQGMRERHWQQLSKELGMEVKLGVTLVTLQDVYGMELSSHQVGHLWGACV